MTLNVQVVSPERVMRSGEADRVITRVIEAGDIAFLTGHTSFLGALGSGAPTEILTPSGEVVKLNLSGGFVEVSDDNVSLLSDKASFYTEDSAS